MTQEEVTLRDYFEIKLQNIDDKLTIMSGLMKDHYEDSCKRFDKLENSYGKLENQTKFARWVQKYAKTALLLLAIFILLITNLSIFVTLLSDSGLIELIKLINNG